MLQDIFLFTSWFDSFSGRYVPRERTKVTDALAHQAKNSMSSVWVEQASDFSKPFLFSDLSV